MYTHTISQDVTHHMYTIKKCPVTLVQMQNHFPSSAAAGDNAATLL